MASEETSKSPIFVDEGSGSDTAGNGTQSSPYLTTVAALVAHGADAQLHVRKNPNEEYAVIGLSALKRAKKGLEQHEKKAAKAEENKARTEKDAAEGKARDEKRIAESKKIVLTEDASLPTAVKASQIAISAYICVNIAY